jgi:SPP1 gp7 family putative phage head morphogenesis protein
MADTVKIIPYSRHVNGRLITVRAHTQVDEAMSHMAGIHKRPHVSSPRGIFTHGLCPSGVHPAGRDTPHCPPAPYQRQTAAELHQVAMSNTVSELLALSAADDWTTAINDGLEHVLLVLGNNPDRNIAEILMRPDVQEALQSAGMDGAQAAIHSISQVWVEEGAPVDSPFLHSILGDMERNGRTFAPRMTSAIQAGDRDKVEQIILRDRLRAAAAEATARTRAQAEAALAQMEQNGVTHVKWVATVDNRTCSACLALNGEIVAIRTQFDHLAGELTTPVYRDLIAPPRHPNCRCRLVPVSKGKK